jgi:hypothetical protein
MCCNVANTLAQGEQINSCLENQFVGQNLLAAKLVEYYTQVLGAAKIPRGGQVRTQTLAIHYPSISVPNNAACFAGLTA